MKKMFLATLVAIVFLNTQPSQAAERSFFVGIWEGNTTMNGYMERSILTLNANGTGKQVRYALGQNTIVGDFKWRLTKDGFIFSSGSPIYVRIQVESFRTIILTPANASFQPIGPDLEFERQIPEEAITATRPFTIIGLWQMTTNYNGYFLHHVIEISADGTGVEDIYYSNAFGKGKNRVAFRWTYGDGVLRRVAANGELALGNIRIVNRTHMTIRHIGGFPMMNGGEFSYELQENQDDEGCQLETVPSVRLATNHQGIRNKYRPLAD